MEEIEKKFFQLAEVWRQETRLTSSTTAIVMHRAYQQIIGMGPVVIPLILRALAKRPEQWFWALHALTHIDPTTAEQRGCLRKMSEAWLRWGRERGYRADTDLWQYLEDEESPPEPTVPMGGSIDAMWQYLEDEESPPDDMEEFELALQDCGDTGEGWCAMEGTEHCDFRCPFRPSLHAAEERPIPPESGL